MGSTGDTYDNALAETIIGNQSIRIGFSDFLLVKGRWGDWQLLADRLDPVFGEALRKI